MQREGPSGEHGPLPPSQEQAHEARARQPSPDPARMSWEETHSSQTGKQGWRGDRVRAQSQPTAGMVTTQLCLTSHRTLGGSFGSFILALTEPKNPFSSQETMA